MWRVSCSCGLWFCNSDPAMQHVPTPSRSHVCMTREVDPASMLAAAWVVLHACRTIGHVACLLGASW